MDRDFASSAAVTRCWLFVGCRGRVRGEEGAGAGWEGGDVGFVGVGGHGGVVGGGMGWERRWCWEEGGMKEGGRDQKGRGERCWCWEN